MAALRATVAIRGEQFVRAIGCHQLDRLAGFGGPHLDVASDTNWWFHLFSGSKSGDRVE
jgi:hypothetical protein